MSPLSYECCCCCCVSECGKFLYLDFGEIIVFVPPLPFVGHLADNIVVVVGVVVTGFSDTCR